MLPTTHSDIPTKCGVNTDLAVRSRWGTARFASHPLSSIPKFGLRFRLEMEGRSLVSPNSQKQINPKLLYVMLPLLVVGLSLWGWAAWTSVPKFKANDEALKTIDALFTAINSHDEKRIATCKTQLEKHVRSGNLSPQAMAELASCCEQATSGSWEDAARRLYRVIEKQ